MNQMMKYDRRRYLLAIGLLGLAAIVAFTTAPSSAAAVSMDPEPPAPTEITHNFTVQSDVVERAESTNPVDSSASSSDESALLYFGDLSDAEKEDLLFMREEEKLARDVYLTLYEQWGVPIFRNIAASEQRHTDAIKMLLDSYGLEDPVTSNEIGQFANQDLQALYDQLIVDGGQSISDALRAGAAIEEIDILDLLEGLSHTDNASIIMVYENLLAGSENHLRAFVRTLERQTGETNMPQYLSQEEFDAIVSSPSGVGGGSRGNRGNQGAGSWRVGKGRNG